MMAFLSRSILILSLTIGSIGQGVEKKTHLVYGESAKIEQFDPYTVHEASGMRLADLIFDDLVEVGPGGEYIPGLAKSWSIEDGGTSIVVHLREQIYWHPRGDEPQKAFNAADVITTIRLLTNPESSIPNADRFQVFKDTQQIAKHTVKISFHRALSDPIRTLMFKVLPDHMLADVKALGRNHPFTRQPIGTGAYRFVSTNPQGEILLESNPNYYKGVPRIEKIVMKPFADQTVMAQSLMFRSLDMVTYLSPKDLREVSGDRQLQLVPYDALSFSFLALNNARPLLRDKRIRQAISYSIHRQEILDAFFQGEGHLITGPFSPTSWAYNLDVQSFDHNPQRARELLRAAGLIEQGENAPWLTSQGQPAKLDFVVPIAGESEMMKRIALAIQAYLQTIGLPSTIRFLEWNVWKEEVLGKHNYDITIASWDFDDAANIASLFHSSSAKPWGNNFVLYRNTKIDSLLSEAEATNDFDKRRAIYKSLHASIADDAPYVFLWTLKHHAAHNDRLVGVRIEPFSFFKHIASWSMKE
ncbi:MAG: ABC transporter substrate-binding protein [Oligoflexus sp.]